MEGLMNIGIQHNSIPGFTDPSTLKPTLFPQQPCQQRDHEQYQENEEQDLGNRYRAGCDAAKPEYSRNNGYNEKY